MKCVNPLILHGGIFGCGQCLPCLLNRRRVWTNRILLEMREHKVSCFLTLTYDQEHLVWVSGRPTLVPRDLTLFLKRYRKLVSPSRVRYFACGEYGEATQRPHYHLALFGQPSCRVSPFGRMGCDCASCSVYSKAWSVGEKSLGHIVAGTMQAEAAAYVAQYVTKKLTRKDHPALLGRHPEFSRQSTNPGIGAGVAVEIASSLLALDGDIIEDVPTAVAVNGRILPLGSYLRRKIRAAMGRDEKTPVSVREKTQEELRGVRAYAESIEKPFALLVKENLVGYEASQEVKASLSKRKSKI